VNFIFYFNDKALSTFMPTVQGEFLRIQRDGQLASGREVRIMPDQSYALKGFAVENLSSFQECAEACAGVCQPHSQPMYTDLPVLFPSNESRQSKGIGAASQEEESPDEPEKRAKIRSTHGIRPRLSQIQQ
jgi:hypothetical protein